MNLKTVLIVEDDVELLEWIVDYLSSKGFVCSGIGNGREAVGLIKKSNPDIVILDGLLPELDGFEVCKTVREFYRGVIIMLTARDDEIDEVLGLESGADDYLVKPVRARALLSRIQKKLGKGNSASNEGILVFNNLSIHFGSQLVLLNGREISLTTKEFEVLWLLASNAGHVVSRETLVKELRGYDFDGYDRSIDLRISRLRKKLDDNSDEPFRVKTVWGKGYLFAKDSW